MFLRLLTKDEKQSFIKIAKKLVITNEKFSDFKRYIVDEYYRELGIESQLNDHEALGKEQRAVELHNGIADYLSSFVSLQSKQIAFFEIAGLMQIDLVLSNEELEILEMARRDLGIAEEKGSLLIRMAGEMVKQYFHCLCQITDIK